jgi:protein TonB
MDLKEKKLIVISFLISVFIHSLIFFSLYLINKKPEEKKEKVITLTLENLPPTQEKPSLQKEDNVKKELPQPKKLEIPEHHVKQEVVKPKVAPKPQVEKTPIQTPQISEKITPKTEETQPQKETPVETSSQYDTNTKRTQSSQSQSQEPKPQPIDISKGRPDSFKQPEKKEEDIDGYLKELIRYLNQQAREKDLYPPIAKRLKIEGQVIVRVTINEDGTIDENSIKIVDPSGYNVLDKGAVEILKKLQPYKKPPKRITVEIPIVFQIIYM